MKIHDKLWYIINPEREDNLAYMTYWEDNAACIKRIATGTGWATPRGEYSRAEGRYLPSTHPAPIGIQIDNTPVAGFNIGSSVSRWSTENKVFRVTDPRGFTVEVPTDNIATLLHLTDVHKGVIQQECIWARDGNSHVLLPVNSEPYLETLKDMAKVTNALSIKDLKLWDVVAELSSEGYEYKREYIYIGQYKVNWYITVQEDTYDYWNNYLRKQNADRYKLVNDVGIVADHKWEHYFLTITSNDKWRVTSLGSSPRLIKLRSGEDDSDKLDSVSKENMPSWSPERIHNKYKGYKFNNRQSVKAEFNSLGERRKV